MMSACWSRSGASATTSDVWQWIGHALGVREVGAEHEVVDGGSRGRSAPSGVAREHCTHTLRLNTSTGFSSNSTGDLSQVRCSFS